MGNEHSSSLVGVEQDDVVASVDSNILLRLVYDDERLSDVEVVELVSHDLRFQMEAMLGLAEAKVSKRRGKGVWEGMLVTKAQRQLMSVQGLVESRFCKANEASHNLQVLLKSTLGLLGAWDDREGEANRSELAGQTTRALAVTRMCVSALVASVQDAGALRQHVESQDGEGDLALALVDALRHFVVMHAGEAPAQLVCEALRCMVLLVGVQVSVGSDENWIAGYVAGQSTETAMPVFFWCMSGLLSYMDDVDRTGESSSRAWKHVWVPQIMSAPDDVASAASQLLLVLSTLPVSENVYMTLWSRLDEMDCVDANGKTVASDELRVGLQTVFENAVLAHNSTVILLAARVCSVAGVKLTLDAEVLESLLALTALDESPANNRIAALLLLEQLFSGNKDERAQIMRAAISRKQGLVKSLLYEQAQKQQEWGSALQQQLLHTLEAVMDAPTLMGWRDEILLSLRVLQGCDLGSESSWAAAVVSAHLAALENAWVRYSGEAWVFADGDETVTLVENVVSSLAGQCDAHACDETMVQELYARRLLLMAMVKQAPMAERTPNVEKIMRGLLQRFGIPDSPWEQVHSAWLEEYGKEFEREQVEQAHAEVEQGVWQRVVWVDVFHGKGVWLHPGAFQGVSLEPAEVVQRGQVE